MSGFESVKIPYVLFPGLLDIFVKLKIDNGNDYKEDLDKELSKNMDLINIDLVIYSI